MSFLHDEKFYIPLLIKSLVKEGQAAASPIDPISVAKKLVNRLSRQLTGAPEALNIASSKDSDLKVNNLQSLGALLKWLSGSQVTLDGARIAYTGAEQSALGEEEKNKLSPVSINESRDAVTRKWNQVDYHANLPLLIKYVSYLQQKASAMNKSGDDQGKVLEVMVGKLIDQINAIKPDSGLDRKPKSTPDKPNEIDDNVKIDDFGTKIFDMKGPTKDRGSLILVAKNIKSRAALNDWLQQDPVAKVAMYDDKGQRKEVLYTDEKVDRCLVLNTFFARAKYWSEIAKTPEDEKKFAFYVKKIQEIGPTFTGPDGKACSITGTLSPTTPGKDQPGKPGGTGGSGKASPEDVGKLVALLPLNPYNVNFDKIESFFNLYVGLVQDSGTELAASAVQAMNDARNAMSDAKALTIRRNVIYDMNEDPSLFAQMLQPPASGRYRNLMNALDRVVTSTKEVVEAFYSQYGNMMNSSNRALTQAQFQGSYSYAVRNRSIIKRLDSRFNEVGKIL